MFDKINCLFRTWNLSVGSKDFINLTWKHKLISHFIIFFIFCYSCLLISTRGKCSWDLTITSMSKFPVPLKEKNANGLTLSLYPFATTQLQHGIPVMVTEPPHPHWLQASLESWYYADKAFGNRCIRCTHFKFNLSQKKLISHLMQHGVKYWGEGWLL